MKTFFAAALSVMSSLSVCASAAAEEPSVGAAAGIEACLAGSGDAPESCIGRSASKCQGELGGGTTIGIGECIMAERTAWDAVLNVRYRKALAAASAMDGRLAGAYDKADVRDSLVAAQRAWIVWRDAECSRLYAFGKEGTIRTIVYADCMRDMTAKRAIDFARQEN